MVFLLYFIYYNFLLFVLCIVFIFLSFFVCFTCTFLLRLHRGLCGLIRVFVRQAITTMYNQPWVYLVLRCSPVFLSAYGIPFRLILFFFNVRLLRPALYSTPALRYFDFRLHTWEFRLGVSTFIKSCCRFTLFLFRL